MNDTLIHRSFVLEIGNKVVLHLLEKRKVEYARILAERVASHDLSKFTKNEFYGMAKFADDVAALKDPNVTKVASDEKMVYIRKHYEVNDHHPEFYKDITEMEEAAMMELAIDWYARSKQYGTDVLECLEIRQANRFHFPQPFYAMLQKTLQLLIYLDQ